MELVHTIKVIFHSLNIFLCLFFSFFLLTPQNRKRSNAWLAAFLLAKSIPALGGFLYHFIELRNWLYAAAPWVFYVDYPFYLFYIPFLYFYILSLTRDSFRFRARDLVHFVPFLLVAVYFTWKIGSTPAEALRTLLLQDSLMPLAESAALRIGIHIQFFLYMTASLLELRRYRHRIKEMYSSIERINLSWLCLVLFGFIGVRSLEIADYIFWLITGSPTIIGLYIASQIFFLAFVSLMVLRALRHPVIFLGTDSPSAQRKYEKTLLAEPVREEYRERLIRYMEERRPFLNPLLSLPDLASQMKIPVHHLSQVLNSCFGQNFFDFVNGYRIRESQRLLSADRGVDVTILDILYETGFNSKSVFNTAFKKITGLTPSQYKRCRSIDPSSSRPD